MRKSLAYEFGVVFHANQQDRFVLTLWQSAIGSESIFGYSDVGVGWHHMAATFDNGSSPGKDRLSIFLDGIRIVDFEMNDLQGGVSNSTSDLLIGSTPGDGWAEGWVEEARLSNSVRYNTASYSVPKGPFSTDVNTAALWHFDEALGSTSSDDATGHGNTLVGVNGAHIGTP